MRTSLPILLLLSLACKGDSDSDGSDNSDTGTIDTNASAPGDSGDDSKDTGEKDTDPVDTGEEDTDTDTDPVDTGQGPEAGPNARPDFSLVDLNDTSPRSGEEVSPRDYLEKVSGWYFTHAT